MRVNEARTPPNSWHFPVTPTITIKGTDKRTLIDRVYEWRLRQNLPLDQVEREIDDYYCTQWPDSCVKEPADYGHVNPSPRSQPPESLLHRVSRWAAGVADKMPRGGYPMVSPEEAARRQAICAQCPQNFNWRTGCRGCSGSAAQLLLQVRALRKGHNDVYGCAVAGWDNNTASNFKAEDLPLSESQLARMDQKCWRRG